MANLKQINYIKLLLRRRGLDPYEYNLSEEMPHNDISTMIDNLLRGNDVPSSDEWNVKMSGFIKDSKGPMFYGEGPKAFVGELGKIRSDFIKDFTTKLLDKAPDSFYELAASSTAKYHPRFCLGSGGVVRHTKFVFEISESLLEHPSLYDFNQTEKDIIRSAILIHDICKYGVREPDKYTKHEHPILVRQLVNQSKLEFEDTEVNRSTIKTILDTVACHMGPWTKNNYSDITLPEPNTELQKFVHLCDYMASRKFYDRFYPGE